MISYLELADYLLIAERVLALPAEAIANFNRIGLAAPGSRSASGDSSTPGASADHPGRGALSRLRGEE